VVKDKERSAWSSVDDLCGLRGTGFPLSTKTIYLFIKYSQYLFLIKKIPLKYILFYFPQLLEKNVENL